MNARVVPIIYCVGGPIIDLMKSEVFQFVFTFVVQRDHSTTFRK